ncbi:hypothetical protein DFP73DRAFT_524298 [Morchella snyderi]|nr:hypothetical protein DFP73DRAFT_524298 [Morchella snyderi]
MVLAAELVQALELVLAEEPGDALVEVSIQCNQVPVLCWILCSIGAGGGADLVQLQAEFKDTPRSTPPDSGWQGKKQRVPGPSFSGKLRSGSQLSKAARSISAKGYTKLIGRDSGKQTTYVYGDRYFDAIGVEHF